MSWWVDLGSPFVNVQFSYRLSGWLLVAVAVLLAISLRSARGLTDGRVNYDFHPRTGAFENGPTEPPAAFYDPHSYAAGDYDP